jgi:hypothetical protein
VRRSYSSTTQSHRLAPRRSPRLSASWRGAAAVVIVVGSLLAPLAADAAPVARSARDLPAAGLQVADSHVILARLEARAARLSRLYRGQLVNLADAASAATAAASQAQRLARQLDTTRQQLGRLAAASYMVGGLDPVLALLSSSDPQGDLNRASALEYLTRQRDARQQLLLRLVTADSRAGQDARAKVAELRHQLAAMASRRRAVERLLAKFQPQSPTIGGDRITPRMREVKDEIDRRFGPFVDIGCYRPGNDGEHPLGRACDFMLSTGGVMPSGPHVQLGYNIAAWAQANASRLGIMYIIYRQRIWDIRMASSGWVPMPDRGSITANHFDHVHISVF